MISKAIEYAVIFIIGMAALWFFNSRIEAYYQAPLIAKHKEAIAQQAKANSEAVESLKAKKSKINTVYVDRIKEVETYAKTLSQNDACRASPEFVRLYNSINR
jgi:hypothetical protein